MELRCKKCRVKLHQVECNSKIYNNLWLCEDCKRLYGVRQVLEEIK